MIIPPINAININIFHFLSSSYPRIVHPSEN
jgi:hypothetical protein